MTYSVGAVVFDLAGVLFDFQGVESIARLSGGRVSADEFGQFWASALADDFYRGRCSPDDFAESAVAAFRLSIAPSLFLQEFRAWLRGPYEGALDLVAQVRRRAVVACLSNTNSLDVARFRDEFALDHVFDHCFFSNELGLRKPDSACYLYVLQHLGFAADPQRVVFFDDTVDCVHGALSVGMRAHVVSTVPALSAHLESLGLLNPSAG